MLRGELSTRWVSRRRRERDIQIVLFGAALATSRLAAAGVQIGGYACAIDSNRW